MITGPFLPSPLEKFEKLEFFHFAPTLSEYPQLEKTQKNWNFRNKLLGTSNPLICHSNHAQPSIPTALEKLEKVRFFFILRIL